MAIQITTENELGYCVELAFNSSISDWSIARLLLALCYYIFYFWLDYSLRCLWLSEIFQNHLVKAIEMKSTAEFIRLNSLSVAYR